MLHKKNKKFANFFSANFFKVNDIKIFILNTKTGVKSSALVECGAKPNKNRFLDITLKIGGIIRMCG